MSLLQSLWYDGVLYTKSQQQIIDGILRYPRRPTYSFHAGMMRPGRGRYTKLKKTNVRLEAAANALERSGILKVKREHVNQDGETFVTYYCEPNRDHEFWAGKL